MNTNYPVHLERADDGGYTVTFPGLPFGVSEGDSVEHALEQAADALVVIITTLMHDGAEVPEPLDDDFEFRVALPVDLALKLAFYRVFKASGITKAELGKRLEWSNTQVARLFDADHNTKVDTLIEALSALGKRINLGVIAVEDVPHSVS